MTEVTLALPTTRYLDIINADLEGSDARELESATGEETLDVLMHSRDVSHECFVALVDGEPVAVIGCAMGDPHGGRWGHPWAVFSRKAREYPRAVLTTGRQFVDRWSALYPMLSNFVDERNARAIRWLKAIGFTMRETTAEFAEDGSPFIRFEKLNV